MPAHNILENKKRYALLYYKLLHRTLERKSNDMEQKFCQSCGMPLTDGNKGANANGSQNEDYCIYCYKDGEFTLDMTMEQMIDHCARFTDEINKQSGQNLTKEQAKEMMRQFFPHLKRWRTESEKSLIEKAVDLLARCKEVTVASINADGFPRPVPMAKGFTVGCNEVWMATGADSEKVADFKNNPKAGLCYSYNGASVALRGTVEIISDDKVRTAMWQEWYINHFHGGPSDPNYVLLRFSGTEATMWIDNEFAHEKLCK